MPIPLLLKQPTRQLGETVYIDIGAHTVKRGKIKGAKSQSSPLLPEDPDQALIEYRIKWDKEGERPLEEWYPEAKVHSTPQEII